MTLAASYGSPLWYASRGTGAVTMILLTAVVLLGMATTTRWQNPIWPKFLSSKVHRDISLVTLAFLAVHIVTGVLDPFAKLGWKSALVPFGSSYRPLWMGLGVVAMEMLAAVAISTAVKQWIGFKWWRYIHYATYACWPLALMHGLATGTDVRSGWFLLLTIVCVMSVFVLLVAWRLPFGWPKGAGFRLLTSVVSGFAVVALALWMLNGPLAAGWAKVAGTPIQLLKH